MKSSCSLRFFLILTAVAEITVANKWIPSDTMCNCTVLLVIIWFDLLIPSDKTRMTWNCDIAPRGIQPAHIWISMLAITTCNVQTLQIYHNEETSSLPSSEIACISNQFPNHCTQTCVHWKCHEQMTSCSYFNKQLSVDCRRAMSRYCNCKARNRNWPQLTTIKIAPKPPTKSEMFKCDQILLRLISFLILAVKV